MLDVFDLSFLRQFRIKVLSQTWTDNKFGYTRKSEVHCGSFRKSIYIEGMSLIPSVLLYVSVAKFSTLAVAAVIMMPVYPTLSPSPFPPWLCSKAFKGGHLCDLYICHFSLWHKLCRMFSHLVPCLSWFVRQIFRCMLSC